MGEFRMPSLGADMEAGTVAQWLVKPGDRVRRGDVVAVIETEKSDIEVETFESGTVDQLLVPEGQRVPVGTPLAVIGPAGSAGPPPAPVAQAPAPPPPPSETPPRTGPGPEPALAADVAARVPSPVVRRLAAELGVDLSTVEGTGAGGRVVRADVEAAAGSATATTRVRASPRARRLAAELGVDLGTVEGTGPGGAVVASDLAREAPSPVAAPVVGTTGTMAGPAHPPSAGARRRGSDEAARAELRRAIGALMARSKREVPHYYLSTTVDLSAASRWLEAANVERPVAERLVMAALLLKATALAVATVPEVNGLLVEGKFEPSSAVHLGVAVSLRGGGVVAPAIRDAERLPLPALMASLRDLVGRARAGVLRSSEVTGQTITVTNLGDLGVESVFGVIYPPQVALVGFGRVGERPWASGGMVGVRPCVTMTLSGDHRVSDGLRGAAYLAAVDRLLQDPGQL